MSQSKKKHKKQFWLIPLWRDEPCRRVEADDSEDAVKIAYGVKALSSCTTVEHKRIKTADIDTFTNAIGYTEDNKARLVSCTVICNKQNKKRQTNGRDK